MPIRRCLALLFVLVFVHGRPGWAMDPYAQAHAYVEEGDRRYAADDFAGALELYRKAYRLEREPMLLVYQARAQLALDRVGDALACLSAIYGDDSASAHKVLELEPVQQKIQLVLVRARELVERDGMLWEVRRQLALLERHRGETKPALLHYLQALKIAGEALPQAAREEADALCKQAFSRMPLDTPPQFIDEQQIINMIDVQLRLAHPDDALAYLERWKQWAPRLLVEGPRVRWQSQVCAALRRAGSAAAQGALCVGAAEPLLVVAPPSPPPLSRRPWFRGLWAGVGVLVAGGVAAAAVCGAGLCQAKQQPSLMAGLLVIKLPF